MGASRRFLESGEHPREGCLRELKEETALEGEYRGADPEFYHREIEMYGSLVVVAYRVEIEREEITINHEVFEAGFYKRSQMPVINIPLHRQIIEESRWLS